MTGTNYIMQTSFCSKMDTAYDIRMEIPDDTKCDILGSIPEKDNGSSYN